jgi:hypothetical protein
MLKSETMSAAFCVPCKSFLPHVTRSSSFKPRNLERHLLRLKETTDSLIAPKASPFLRMANPTICQALPRFLLPRLSWQPVPLHHHAVRALSTVPARYNGPSRSRDPPARSVVAKYGSIRPSSSTLQDPAHRRAFHATARRARDHHFDTLKFVQRLREEGFTEPQAVAMMKVLSDVIEERLDYS